MASRLLFTLLLALMLSCQAIAQSADQEVVSVVDSPDPVVPGQTITYTITLRNNGPNPAVNGGLNVNLGGELSHVSNTPPPGFTCFVAGNNMTCNTPSFAVGTVQIVIVARLNASLLNFPDGSVTSAFFPSGTTIDPVPGNNQKSVATAWDSPQIDLSISVNDTPDPVGPDQHIVYSISVNQAGPDPAQNVNVNAFNNGTLRFQAISVPAGFVCTPLAVGATPTLTCSASAVPVGTYVFSLTVLADDAILGTSDGTVAMAFNTNGTGNDVNPSNNDETEQTIYRTPDADLVIAVDDLPDPAQLGGDFVYLVTMHNQGPDAASNATISMFNNGSLRFQSIEAPLGSTCTLPAVGSTPTLSCRVNSLAAGSDLGLIVTVRADEALIGPNGGTVSSAFTAASPTQDPNGFDNSLDETTAVLSPLLFRDGFE